VVSPDIRPQFPKGSTAVPVIAALVRAYEKVAECDVRETCSATTIVCE
jgi:hypothetical protein